KVRNQRKNLRIAEQCNLRGCVLLSRQYFSSILQPASVPVSFDCWAKPGTPANIKRAALTNSHSSPEDPLRWLWLMPLPSSLRASMPAQLGQARCLAVAASREASKCPQSEHKT